MEKEIVKGYKGFDKDLKCRGYQYEIGKTHVTDEDVSICKKGFHAVPAEDSPLDVFGFYSPSDENGMNRYCEIEASGKIVKGDDKIAASRLKVVAEIGIIGIVKAHVEWVMSRVKKDGKKSAHKDEDKTIATNTGDYSAATNTGDYSAATNTGDKSAATNTGDYSAADVSGEESIAIVTGKDSKARGALGCWLVLTERGEWNGKTYPIIEVRAVKVDGKEIKPETWYELKNGKVVEI